MIAVLTKEVSYRSIEELTIVLAPGTHVEVCLEDGMARLGDDWFDIQPNEYETTQLASQ